MVRLNGALALILALSLCASACGGTRQPLPPESSSSQGGSAASVAQPSAPAETSSSQPATSAESQPEESQPPEESQASSTASLPEGESSVSSQPEASAPSSLESQPEGVSQPESLPPEEPSSAEPPPPESGSEPPEPSSDPAPEQPSPGEEISQGCRWLNINEAAILTLINKERGRMGLQPLTLDPDLTAAARVRADELYRGNYVGHTRPDGEPWETVLQRDVPVEFSLAGENLAWSNHAIGQDIPPFQWFQMWKESESHYAAMLGERYTHCGVAVLAGPYFDGEEQSYAVTLFCSY